MKYTVVEKGSLRMIGSKQQSFFHRRKALTILEILLSVAILSVASVLIVKVFFLSDQINKKTKDYDDAVFSAVSVIELVHYEDLASIRFESVGADGSIYVVEKEGFSPEHRIFVGEDEVLLIFDSGRYVGSKAVDNDMQAKIAITPTDASFDISVTIQKNEVSIYELSKSLHYREVVQP